MKSISVSFVVTIFITLMGFTYVANAQTQEDIRTLRTNALEARQAVRQEAKETRQDAKQERIEIRQDAQSARASIRRASTSEARAERRAVLSDRIQARVTNLAANISNRIDAAIVRMRAIITRMETRIGKISAAGVDTSISEAHMADAKTFLNEAENAIGNIDIKIAGVVGSENPREVWKIVKADLINIKKLLKDAHQSLRATVVTLKEAVTNAKSQRGTENPITERTNGATVDNGEPEEIDSSIE